ncbi:hypothetical protein [Vineibacter terrae]|uniref:hypothetical protein n=1 Tax=Vineibacter terrae TaxID=2586908 RepID=UPI002E318EE1|nr:hypothetical protein [Vineibacter terrae]HEX2888366.1 hypothetical protein [Vineibacter terrae]
MRLLIAVASAVLATTAAARVNAQPALWDPGTGVVPAQADMTPSEKAARSDLEAAGYSQVKDIKSGPEGITAKAVKEGKEVAVVVDSGGRIKELRPEQ